MGRRNVDFCSNRRARYRTITVRVDPLLRRIYTAQQTERVDRACHRLFPSVSRRTLKAWLRMHPPQVEGGVATPSTLLKPGMRLEVDDPGTFEDVLLTKECPRTFSSTGDEVSIEEKNAIAFIKTSSSFFRKEDISFSVVKNVTCPQIQSEILPIQEEQPSILFQDQHLIAMYKPSSWPTHPIHPWETKTASQWLLERCPFLLGIGSEHRAPGLLHRLDNTTSGLLLFAKTPGAFLSLKTALEEKRWRKEYLACVQGKLVSSLEVEEPITHHPKQSKKMILCVELSSRLQKRCSAQPARTEIQPITYHAERDETLVRVRIETGVRHQIRLHLAFVQHPIVGDVLYGGPPDSERLWLHAWALLLPSPPPSSTQVYALYAPCPSLLERFFPQDFLKSSPYGYLFEDLRDASSHHSRLLEGMR